MVELHLDIMQRKWSLAVRSTAAVTNTVGEIRGIPLDRPEEVVDSLALELSAAERSRASRYYFERDRRRFIVARGEMRRILAARLDTVPSSIEFTYGPYGKPALAPPFDRSGWRFNLAHSEDLALIALCRNGEVGIDVEAIRTLQDEAQLVASCFSPREQAEYHSLGPSDRREGFFRCWTGKEAFIKGLGKGLSQPLDSFDVSISPELPAQISRQRGWCLARFTPASGFIAAVVTRGQECHVI
jgi:4'-phosphopantetheinyl transferase